MRISFRLPAVKIVAKLIVILTSCLSLLPLQHAYSADEEEAALPSQFRCTAELHSRWTSQPESGKNSKKKEMDPKEHKELWGRYEQFGTDEKVVRATLERIILRERSYALAKCKRQHENLSGCVIAKLSSRQGDLATLDFSARHAIRDAVTSDCQTLQGKCLDDEVPEIKCEEEKPPVVEEEEDSKKKKK